MKETVQVKIEIEEVGHRKALGKKINEANSWIFKC